MGRPLDVLRFLAVSIVVLPSTASAQSRDQLIERCRMTVGRTIVQACMRSRGATAESQRDLAECRSKAGPQVRNCVMAAMGGRQGNGGRNDKSGGAQSSAGGENLPVGHISDIPSEFPVESNFNPDDFIGSDIATTFSIHQTLATQQGRRLFSRLELNLTVRFVSADTLEMVRARQAYDSNNKKIGSEPEFKRTFKLGETVDSATGKTIWAVDAGRLTNIFTVNGAAGRVVIEFSGSKEDARCKAYFGYSREDGSEKVTIRSLTGVPLDVLNAKMETSSCQIQRH